MCGVFAGTESQRVLVAVMRKLTDTTPMAAFDHKGRCVFANTPLASMLGYKLSVLRTKEISQLLPQPYGRLHMKWITVRGDTRLPAAGKKGVGRQRCCGKCSASSLCMLCLYRYHTCSFNTIRYVDPSITSICSRACCACFGCHVNRTKCLAVAGLQEAGSMSARQTPNSCRNSNTSIMLSSNSTPIYVKTDIIAQNAGTAGHGLIDGANDTIWAVKVTRSSKEALVGERRMRLLVSSDGRILWASPASPAALFGLEPAALVGQKLQGFIDVFAEYCSGEAAVPVGCALRQATCGSRL
jgi:hypothetical protein